MLKIVDIFICHDAKLVNYNDICNNIFDIVNDNYK